MKEKETVLAQSKIVIKNLKEHSVPADEKDPGNWLLAIVQGDSDVVIAWHKTREGARQQARQLRKALKIKNVSIGARCGS